MLDNYKSVYGGVIKQDKIGQLKEYDEKYITDSYEKYGEAPNYMAYLRLGLLHGVIKNDISSVLDVGYGNGAFLKVLHEAEFKTYGSDISGYPVPEGVEFVEWGDVFKRWFDVICFFDVLEHFEDIEFVKDLNCKYLYISVPWCHNHSDEWFRDWKHRRPDEHIFHFNDVTLTNFMREMGYDLEVISNIEDTIRTPEGRDENILTGIFKQRYA